VYRVSIELRQLSKENGLAEYDMLQDIDANEYGFTNEVKGMTFEEYKEWLVNQDDYSKARNLPENFIPQTTYFLYVDDQPVGIARIRHSSVIFLKSRVWELWLWHCKVHRGKGYGDILFKKVMEKCKLHGYSKVKSFVHVDNIASNKVFIRNGAVHLGVLNGIKNIYETVID
jgi:predicted acetyltransferase